MTAAVAHLVTYRYPPFGGGLETSVERIAGFLAATGTATPAVHIGARDAILLQRSIAAVAAEHCASTRHVIISFYATQEGPVAQEAASALRFPHIVAIRGSDYSFGFHEPATHARLQQLLTRAAWITTTNDEQARSIRRTIGLGNVTRIHNSLPDAVRSMRHARRPPDGTVRLFADCGYSFKKGTIVLLDAFAELRRNGMPVTLTLCGPDESENGAFWRSVRDECSRMLGDHARLYGRLDAEGVRSHLLSADIYCSATLGEGCSLARSAAMIAGIPIVSTRCGELADLAADVSHVKLVAPADAEGFYRALRGMCSDVLGRRRVTVDLTAVERWHGYFRPEREQAEWQRCTANVVQAFQCKGPESLA